MDGKKIIRADSCIFADEMVSYEEKKRISFVHVFRVFESVCDIFRVKSAWNQSWKSFFLGKIQVKRVKMSVKVFCKSLRYSG